MRKEVENALELLREKKPDALERALALLQNTVFSFSMKVCGHRQDAEDTAQDVLLKSVPYLGKFDSPKALAVWLYTVAKNRCLMSRRRSKFAPREHLSLEELMPDRQELEAVSGGNGGTPEQAVLRGESADRLRQVVLKLPPPYRLVLVLHDMEELSTEEIARVTGLRPGTVRVRLHRARLFMRRELSRTEGKPGPQARRPKTQVRPRRCRELFAALSEYIDDRLDDSMCERLEQHLGECRPCESFLASLEDTVKSLRDYSPAQSDSQRAAVIREKLLQRYPELLKPRS